MEAFVQPKKLPLTNCRLSLNIAWVVIHTVLA